MKTTLIQSDDVYFTMDDIFDDDDGIDVSEKTRKTGKNATQISNKTLNLCQTNDLNKPA